MRRVFSIEPEGMTRAWPMVPLIRRNASPTQNQAMSFALYALAHGKLRLFGGFAGAFRFSDFLAARFLHCVSLHVPPPQAFP